MSESNIDSRTMPAAHDRFNMAPPGIRLLLIATRVPSFSAAC
jgi:hypothetical protein